MLTFTIKKIKDKENSTYFLRDYTYAKEHGFNIDEYEDVYEDSIEESDKIEDTLDEIFDNINTKQYSGISHMSVSDIIELRGVKYYCDNMGWSKIPFISKEDLLARVKIDSEKLKQALSDGTYDKIYHEFTHRMFGTCVELEDNVFDKEGLFIDTPENLKKVKAQFYYVQDEDDDDDKRLCDDAPYDGTIQPYAIIDWGGWDSNTEVVVTQTGYKFLIKEFQKILGTKIESVYYDMCDPEYCPEEGNFHIWTNDLIRYIGPNASDTLLRSCYIYDELMPLRELFAQKLVTQDTVEQEDLEDINQLLLEKEIQLISIEKCDDKRPFYMIVYNTTRFLPSKKDRHFTILLPQQGRYCTSWMMCGYDFN